jgi:hypothetical protein
LNSNPTLVIQLKKNEKKNKNEGSQTHTYKRGFYYRSPVYYKNVVGPPQHTHTHTHTHTQIARLSKSAQHLCSFFWIKSTHRHYLGVFDMYKTRRLYLGIRSKGSICFICKCWFSMHGKSISFYLTRTCMSR